MKKNHQIALACKNKSRESMQTSGKNYTLLAFLEWNTRGGEGLCRWGREKLRRRIGWDARTFKARYANLVEEGWVEKLKLSGGLEVTKVLTMADSFNDDNIYLRCGPIQNDELVKVGPAIKTFRALALHVNPETLQVEIGNRPIADLVQEETGLSTRTVRRHIATLKKAKLLHGWPGRLDRNRKEWYLSATLLEKQEPSPF